MRSGEKKETAAGRRTGTRSSEALEELAGTCGILTSYTDAMNQHRRASEESLRAVLSILGVQAGSPADIRDAIEARRRQDAGRPLPAVRIVRAGRTSATRIRVSRDDGKRIAASVRLELGGTISCRTSRKDATGFEVTLPPDLPAGYHELEVDGGADSFSGALFCAPARCFSRADTRAWGIFTPVYALRSDRNWGAGDLSDLATTLERTCTIGGDFVGILPLLAAFLDEPMDPSPYSPMSRLHWNEFFLDVTSAPGFSDCEAARALVEREDFQIALRELRDAPAVDYQNVMRKKREVLELLSSRFHESGDRRDYEAFLRRHPDVESYAAFRATHEKRGEAWRGWPEDMQRGSLPPSSHDEQTRRYHTFVQWAMHEALESFAKRDHSPGLYLDYPLGVHPDGYDTWRHQDLFALGTSVGAPPDAFFTRGQNWGFPPARPDMLLESRLEYFIATVRNQLRYAGMLRIDHVMALNRLFWIPEGADPSDGVYLKYPAEAMYAVLAIESHRHRSTIIGEDLGTVPEEVREMMEQKGVRRMFVLQYELSPDQKPARPVREAIASINTHDMPTFTCYWKGMDIEQRKESGLLDEKGGREEQQNRKKVRRRLADYLAKQGHLDSASKEVQDHDVLTAALEFLAESDAEMVLVNLEDLWQETIPQNVPGTPSENNWKRKLPQSIEASFALPAVASSLQRIDERRRQRRK